MTPKESIEALLSQENYRKITDAGEFYFQKHRIL
jgi:hypothetical protein